MITLGIDTSNYATSVALVDNAEHKVLFSKKIFLPVKEGEKGIRQQQAVFEHIKNLTDIFSNLKIGDIGAIGVSAKPKDEESSYMPCFLVGKMCAASIGASADVPVVYTSHQTGHLVSALFDINDDKMFENQIIMFHVSGGTTDIVLAEGGQAVKTLGSSLDLFAGQVVDRLGVKLGYPFPAGKYVSELANACSDKVQKPKICVNECNCNLSGLENQCNKLLADNYSKEYVCKYCLAFIAHTVEKMIANARKVYGDLPVVMAGGVMSSTFIKTQLTSQINNITFVKPEFSRDNAIGVAVNAYRKVKYG